MRECQAGEPLAVVERKVTQVVVAVRTAYLTEVYDAGVCAVAVVDVHRVEIAVGEETAVGIEQPVPESDGTVDQSDLVVGVKDWQGGEMRLDLVEHESVQAGQFRFEPVGIRPVAPDPTEPIDA